MAFSPDGHTVSSPAATVTDRALWNVQAGRPIGWTAADLENVLVPWRSAPTGHRTHWQWQDGAGCGTPSSAPVGGPMGMEGSCLIVTTGTDGEQGRDPGRGLRPRRTHRPPPAARPHRTSRLWDARSGTADRQAHGHAGERSWTWPSAPTDTPSSPAATTVPRGAGHTDRAADRRTDVAVAFSPDEHTALTAARTGRCGCGRFPRRIRRCPESAWIELSSTPWTGSKTANRSGNSTSQPGGSAVAGWTGEAGRRCRERYSTRALIVRRNELPRGARGAWHIRGVLPQKGRGFLMALQRHALVHHTQGSDKLRPLIQKHLQDHFDVIFNRSHQSPP